MNDFKKIQELADYCAHCVTKPCQVGCPLNNDITGFITLVKEKKIKEAYELLSKTTVLPSVCGRICPHEKQCQGMCVKKVSFHSVEIGKLEAFVGDMALKNHWKIETTDMPIRKKKVAVVGAGPASLTCAAFLKRNGYPVTIFEKYEHLGGLMYHGIPEFRLPKKLLKEVIDEILDLEIEVRTKEALGSTFTLNDLEKEYDAIFLGFGANVSAKMNISGEDLVGVYGGNELLKLNNHPNYTNKVVVVSGGGNVAMDVSRTVKRLGAKKVYVVYRRSMKEAPAEKKEIEAAMDEGIEFLFQKNIIKILGDKYVTGVELKSTKLEKVEGKPRLEPVNIEGTENIMACDYVIMAVGAIPEKSVVSSLGLLLDKRGKIVIDENGRTSKENVFAGGDLAGVKGTVAFAARSGRNAADAIKEYLEKKR